MWATVVAGEVMKTSVIMDILGKNISEAVFGCGL